MMAAVLYGKEHLQVEPVAVPKIGPGDMLVRVQVALTCGTDVKVFRRGYHARMIVPPAVFGHELAGDIVARGRRCHAISDRPARGGRQFGALRRLLLLQPRPGESLRGSAVQQRRLRRVHSHSRRASSSGTRMRFRTHVSLSGRRAGRAAGLRAARPGRDRHSRRRYRRHHRPGTDRTDVRAAGQSFTARA